MLDAPVTLFVMGAEEWRDYSDWPPPGSEPVRWFFHSKDARTRASATVSCRWPPPATNLRTSSPPTRWLPRASIGGHSCCLNFVAPMGPADQTRGGGVQLRPRLHQRTTGEPMELVGDVTVTLYAATSARDTDWTARLCEVYPDGRSINLQEGIVQGALPGEPLRTVVTGAGPCLLLRHPARPRRGAYPCREPAARHRREQRFPAVGPQPQHGRRPLPGTCQRRSGCDPHRTP